MNKEILKSVLADYRMEIPKHILVPRHFIFEDFGNYVLVGMRRAGKSYLLYQRIQELLNSNLPLQVLKRLFLPVTMDFIFMEVTFRVYLIFF